MADNHSTWYQLAQAQWLLFESKLEPHGYRLLSGAELREQFPPDADTDFIEDDEDRFVIAPDGKTLVGYFHVFSEEQIRQREFEFTAFSEEAGQRVTELVEG